MDFDKYSTILIKNVQNRFDLDKRNQAWLADMTKMTRATISRIMTGETKFPSLDTICKIAHAFDCEPSDLLADYGPHQDLILDIIAKLPTLNETELKTISGAVDHAISRRSRSKSSTGT